MLTIAVIPLVETNEELAWLDSVSEGKQLKHQTNSINNGLSFHHWIKNGTVQDQNYYQEFYLIKESLYHFKRNYTIQVFESKHNFILYNFKTECIIQVSFT